MRWRSFSPITLLLTSPSEVTDIFYKGASGGAATNVITEYQTAWPRQKSAFMAEIVFYRKDKIMSIVQNEFRAYYEYSFGDLDKVDDATQELMHAHYVTAIETFKAVLADRDEFRDDEAIESFFAVASSADDRIILQTLNKWIEATVIQYGAEEESLYLTAHTVEELSRKTEPFVRTCTHKSGYNGGPCPSLWPLVEIVRIGLQRPLLQRSIVLADLPG